MDDLKSLSVQKRADYSANLYNNINVLLDNIDNVKDQIAQRMALGKHHYVLYKERYQRKIKYCDIVFKTVRDPYTDTIKHRVRNDLPECKLRLLLIEYQQGDYIEVRIEWGGVLGCIF